MAPIPNGVFIPAVLQWALSHPWFQSPPPRSGGHEHFGQEFVDAFVERCSGSVRAKQELQQYSAPLQQQQQQHQHSALVESELLQHRQQSVPIHQQQQEQQCTLMELHSAPVQQQQQLQLTRNMVRTALELTAVSIVASIRLHVGPIKVVGGGGGLVGGRPAGGRVMLSGGGARNPTLVARLRTLAPELTWLTTEAAGIHPDANQAVAFAVLGYLTLAGSCGNTLATGARELSVLGKICHPGAGKSIPSFPKL